MSRVKSGKTHAVSAGLDKLKPIGQVVAEMSHEIKNPLTPVRGFLQMLLQREEYQKDKEYFILMINELDKANEIINEYLTLAQNKYYELKKEDINQIIKVLIVNIILEAAKGNIFIVFESSAVPQLLLDKREISYLMLNLLSNSIEAMPNGGRLTIATYTEGDSIVLKVEDTGNGIPEDIIDQLGTPFLTTKKQKLGLGLAICCSIAHRHNANIELTTGETGSAFYVKFKVNESAE